MCDDALANRNTTEVYQVGNHYDGEFHVCPGVEGPDYDWIKVDLVYGDTYTFRMRVFGATDGEPATLLLFDHNGHLDDRFDRSTDQVIEYTARRTGTFYLQTYQGDFPEDTHYEIFSFPTYHDTRSRTGVTRHNVGFKNNDKFESIVDVDILDVKLYQGRNYKFQLDANQFGGGALTTAFFELKDDQGNSVFTSPQVGNDGRVYMAVTPASTGDYTLEVTGGGTGQFSIYSWLDDDFGAGQGTNGQLLFDSEGKASSSGQIGARGDIDWFKVNLNQNDIVRVSIYGKGEDYLGSPTLIFRDPNGGLVGSQVLGVPARDVESSELMSYYKVSQTGTYYAIARSNDVTRLGGYDLKVEKVRTPLDANNLFGRGENRRVVLKPGQAEIKLADLIDDHGIQPTHYQVFSGVPLRRNGQLRGTQLYWISPESLNEWTISGDFDGQEDLFIRAFSAREWSQWIKFPVYGKPDLGGLDSGKHWQGDTVTYRFVPQLPDYYSNDPPPGFEALNSVNGNGKRVVDALNSFVSEAKLDISLQEINTGDADINIFMATGMPGWTISYWPGNNRGGDLILNANIYGSDTSEDGSRNYYEILRGVGKVLGLSPVQMERYDTVMGNLGYNGSDPFPNGPGVYDILQLGEIYGSSLFDPTASSSSNSLTVIDGQEMVTTIGNESKGISVSASVGAGGAYVDLRDGAKSYILDDNVPSREVFVGVGAQVYEARGSIGNDSLYGNGLSNLIHGADGNDFLIGLGENDSLYGGRGNDIYIHYFGDGNDVIFDLDGTDTLCFFGRDDFFVDDLPTDYLFSKTDNYLQVDLTYNGGPNEGSVKIYTGNNGSNLIESLELWHGHANSERISLFNLFNQMGAGESKRFRVLAQQDTFGSLVAPV